MLSIYASMNETLKRSSLLSICSLNELLRWEVCGKERNDETRPRIGYEMKRNETERGQRREENKREKEEKEKGTIQESVILRRATDMNN